MSSGAAADTYNGSKAVLCIASHAACPTLVAFGCSDRALRLWDTRGKPGSDALAVTTQGAHGGWVTAVAWCPSSQHHIASGSHDGTIKMWDIRTQVGPRPGVRGNTSPGYKQLVTEGVTEGAAGDLQG